MGPEEEEEDEDGVPYIEDDDEENGVSVESWDDDVETKKPASTMLPLPMPATLPPGAMLFGKANPIELSEAPPLGAMENPAANGLLLEFAAEVEVDVEDATGLDTAGASPPPPPPPPLPPPFRFRRTLIILRRESSSLPTF